MSNLSEAIKDVDTNEKNNPVRNSKIIKENMYPKKYSEKKISDMINEILSDWKSLLDSKGITRTIVVRYKEGKIYLNQSNFETIYNIDDRTIDGHVNDVVEDLRDYLRRRGIKIYTGNFFKSIKPEWVVS